MKDSQRYIERSRELVRLAAMSPSEAERTAYENLAGAYVQMAAEAARHEAIYGSASEDA